MNFAELLPPPHTSLVKMMQEKAARLPLGTDPLHRNKAALCLRVGLGELMADSLGTKDALHHPWTLDVTS